MGWLPPPTAAAPVPRRKCGEEGCQGHQQRYCAIAPLGFEYGLDVNGAGGCTSGRKHGICEEEPLARFAKAAEGDGVKP